MTQNLQAATNKIKKTKVEKDAVEEEKQKLMEKSRKEKKALEGEVAELGDELRAANKELKLWVLFWGWVQTQSRPATLKWLQKLWQKGPRRARDRCWGGGQ